MDRNQADAASARSDARQTPSPHSTRRVEIQSIRDVAIGTIARLPHEATSSSETVVVAVRVSHRSTVNLSLRGPELEYPGDRGPTARNVRVLRSGSRIRWRDGYPLSATSLKFEGSVLT
jgi:hypothetical protein